MSDQRRELQQAARKFGIGEYERHVLLCTGPTCCSEAEGMRSWEVLKEQIKKHQLSSGENACFRTKVGCLRVCCHGPTVLVYPEGTWYSGMTADRIERLVREHLVEGNPIEEWIFARNPLGAEEKG